MSEETEPKDIDLYIQEAFFRGWAEGYRYCYTPIRKKEKWASTAMICHYKGHKRGIKAAVREIKKRGIND